MSYWLLLAAAAAGLLPHLPNFSPMFGAMLYGGARLRRRDAAWLPLATMAVYFTIEAVVIAHTRLGRGLLWTVAAAVPLVAAGGLLRGRDGWLRLGAASWLGATGFFLISNFGVWISGRMFPHTGMGLGACYLAAIPFYGNSILAAMLFGSFLLVADDYVAGRRAAAAMRSHLNQAGPSRTGL